MKIMVVDDEAPARERLLRMLGRLRPDASLSQAVDGAAALERVRAEIPDVVLLDVRMPGLDGVEVANRLAALESPPAVIFCTAYDEYALEALRHRAAAYLLKPVAEDELESALRGAGRVNRLQSLEMTDTGSRRTTLTATTHRGLETLEVNRVRCFLAEQKYVAAVSPDRTLLLQESLKDLEREFASMFVRVHRNALVAVAHVERLKKTAVGGWQVVLDGVAQCPAVSRRHLADVKQRIRYRGHGTEMQ